MSSDLISRQAAITIPILPKEHREYQTMNLDDAYELGWLDYQECIEDLPSAEPELIKINIEDFSKEDLERLKKEWENAPITVFPTQLKQKNGKWIDEPVYKQMMDRKTWDGFTYCSECKDMHEYGYRSNYCPHCGAKMDEGKYEASSDNI